MAIKRAMVLAAGMGTRLRPLTEEMPKALAPLAGRPLIHYALHWLCRQGITEVVVNAQYMADMLCDALGHGEGLGLDIVFSREDELLGTGGGIGRAAPLFHGESIALMNADTLIDADLAAISLEHAERGADATLVAVELYQPEEYTPVWIDKGGNVREFGGDGGPGLTPVVYTGLSVLGPGITGRLPADRFACLVKDGLVPAISEGKTVAAHVHRGYWKGLDTMERINEAEEDIRKGIFSAPS